MSESLYTSQTPVSEESDLGVIRQLGMQFATNTAGSVTGWRLWIPAAGCPTIALWQLWRVSDTTRLANVDVAATSPGAGGWASGTLGSPVALSVAETYRVVGYTSGGNFVYTDNGSDTFPLTSAHLSADTGVFRNGGLPTDFPNTAYLAYFFADVLFDLNEVTATIDATAPVATATTDMAQDYPATLDAMAPAATVTADITQDDPATLNATAPAATATTNVVTSSNSSVDPSLMNFGPIVTSLAECVCEALESSGYPVCSCCLDIGQPVSECDCRCVNGAAGRVSLYPQSMVPSNSWPQALPAWDRYDRACGPPYIMLVLNIEITRCVPTIDESGNPPLCPDLTAAGLAWYTDATIVRQAVGCCLRDMKLSATIQRFSMGQTTPVPEQGGCAGSVLQVMVGLSHCLCPE